MNILSRLMRALKNKITFIILFLLIWNLISSIYYFYSVSEMESDIRRLRWDIYELENKTSNNESEIYDNQQKIEELENYSHYHY